MLSLILIFESQTKFVQSVTYIEIKIKSTCNDCLQGKFKIDFFYFAVIDQKRSFDQQDLSKKIEFIDLFSLKPKF